MYAGATAPTGWLMCDGTAISRTDYPKLFSIIGTTYGAGDGSTTFNLPDMVDKVPVGAGNTYSLNASGGSNSISYTPAGTNEGTKLSDAQIAHGHGFTQPTVNGGSHRHIISKDHLAYQPTESSGVFWGPRSPSNSTYTGYDGGHTHTVSGGAVQDLSGASSTRTTHTHTFTGTATNIDVRQPYRGINFIIYAGK